MLENGVGEEHRPIVYGFNWPNNLIRVAIVNVKGHETACASSMQNTTEVEVVIEILMQFLKSGFIEIQNIGVITPYDA
jgi:superfamily I DNA and/or RNA helicase